MNLKGRELKTDKRQQFYTRRGISQWNSPPQEAVEAKCFASFQKGLDLYMDTFIITNASVDCGRN